MELINQAAEMQGMGVCSWRRGGAGVPQSWIQTLQPKSPGQVTPPAKASVSSSVKQEEQRKC